MNASARQPRCCVCGRHALAGAAAASRGQERRPLSPSYLALLHRFLSTNSPPTTKTRPLLATQVRSPTPSSAAPKHHQYHRRNNTPCNAARFSRVSALVVDCCRLEHSTAPQSNRPRLLLSSFIDRSAIHRLTASRIATHPRLLDSAHSTPPPNSKSARPPSPVLCRVTRISEWRLQEQRASSSPTQQPAARHSSIATPPPRRCDQSNPTVSVAYLTQTYRANDASRVLASLIQHSPPCPSPRKPPPAVPSAPPRLREVVRRRVCISSRRRLPRCRFNFTLTSSSDPNQPKRGLSAYMFFANEQRDKVREDNPGIKFGMLYRLYSSINMTDIFQARSARSSVSSGSPSTTSRRSPTMPRPRPTSSVTRRRRLPTLP